MALGRNASRSTYYSTTIYTRLLSVPSPNVTYIPNTGLAQVRFYGFHTIRLAMSSCRYYQFRTLLAPNCRFLWLRGLRHRSAAAWLMGLWVRIQPGARISVCFEYCVCVVVSASGCSIVQRCPTECDVSECDHESSIMRRPWPTGAVAPW
jgi:hypothetical protein